MVKEIKIDEQTDKVPSIIVDFRAVTIKDTTLMPVNINGKNVKVPRMYIDNPTAIAGDINGNGTVTFHRCKPANIGKYESIKVEGLGTIKHNGQFGARLEAFKGGD